MTSKNEGINEARDRLRQKAQNEATCFALSDLLRLKEKEVESLRDQVNGLTGSLDRAERALKEAQEQEPLTWETSSELMDILKNPIFARPVPAAPAVANVGILPIMERLRDDLLRAHATVQDALHVVGQRPAAPAVPDARLHPEWKGRNKYGLDMDYFRRKLEQVLRELDRFTPEEFARVMATHSRTADSDVIAREFQANTTPAVPEEWREVLRECADDLAIELDQRYGDSRKYPSEQRKYENEMQPVYRARTLLQSAPQNHSGDAADMVDSAESAAIQHHPV